MNAKEMVKEKLIDVGFDGLYNVAGECFCDIDDLMPCWGISEFCEAGHKITKDDPEWDETLCEDYDFVIIANLPNRKACLKA